jgi:hypothetical protein
VVTVIVADPAACATTIPRSPPETPYPVTVTDATLAFELFQLEQHDVQVLPFDAVRRAEKVDCWPTLMVTCAEGSMVTKG